MTWKASFSRRTSPITHYIVELIAIYTLHVKLNYHTNLIRKAAHNSR
jgi:hypothetical protein